MIAVESWIAELIDRLKMGFAGRLLFVGLQGSYRRGEATKDSDIDIVVVLDRLMAGDLKAYREILAGMEHGEKACGFVSGKNELLHWPKYEIFQLMNETRPYFGTLEGMLPSVCRNDVIESVRIGASNLYHSACHAFLYDEAETFTKTLRGLYKGMFFIMQLEHYLQSGIYIDTKQGLLPLLVAEEREIISISMCWNEYREKCAANPEEYFDKIIAWCSKALTSVF